MNNSNGGVSSGQLHKSIDQGFFTPRKHGSKLPEEAPLLADDNSADQESADEQAWARRDDSGLNIFQKAWCWLKDHLFMVAIVLLLFGGAIALSVYFACPYTVLRELRSALILAVLHNPSEKTTKPSTICLTPSCVLAASEILENISPDHQSIDPCTNFDKFVCGGFEEKHDLRADQGSLFTGTLMAENAQQILRHVLETPYEADHVATASSAADREIFEKLQDGYHACMDEVHLKEIGSAPLLTILRRIESLFPAKGSQRAKQDTEFPQLITQQQLGLAFEADDRLSETVIYLASIGVTSLVDVGVGVCRSPHLSNTS